MSSQFDPVRLALEDALKKEKRSLLSVFLKSLTIGTLFTFLICFLVFHLESSTWNTGNICFAGILLTMTTLCFYLYFQSGPHLEPQGFLSRWTAARFLLGMIVISAVQIWLCPELRTHGEVEGPIPLFGRLTEIYFNWGGMTACMFLCGLTFTSLGMLLALTLVKNSLRWSDWKTFVSVILLALLGQIPVIAIQLSNSHSREYFPYWISGSFTSSLLIVLIFRFALSKMKYNTEKHVADN